MCCQIEAYEYEVEELQGNLKKKAKPPARLVQLEDILSVHKKHTIQLEKALRCLDNDAITPDEVDALRDDMEYYLVGSTQLLSAMLPACDIAGMHSVPCGLSASDGVS